MKTALYEAHLALGAKMVEFGGWEMPIQYSGIIHEHQVVRQGVGIFDVSHMGRICIKGKEAEHLLDYLSTNHILTKPEGSATYTVWCNATGACIDDLIVYKQHTEDFFVVVNAANRQKDLKHLLEQAKAWGVTIADTYHDGGILAVQGPLATALMARLFPETVVLAHMHFVNLAFQGGEICVSRTGYTGEDGFEIYAPNHITLALWQLLLNEGKNFNIEPIGLGARDTLRLEMGYALYGHEISADIAPTESVSAWTVKFDKSDFLGKAALEALQRSPTKRREYGVVLLDKGIAREGYEVYQAEECIGRVTSGTFSPSLSQAIAIILVERKLQEGDMLAVKVRQQLCRAMVTRLPFVKR